MCHGSIPYTSNKLRFAHRFHSTEYSIRRENKYTCSKTKKKNQRDRKFGCVWLLRMQCSVCSLYQLHISYIAANTKTMVWYFEPRLFHVNRNCSKNQLSNSIQHTPNDTLEFTVYRTAHLPEYCAGMSVSSWRKRECVWCDGTVF